MLFTIECETAGREVYQIYADSEEQAKDILYSGGQLPVLSEVTSFSITSVKEQT